MEVRLCTNDDLAALERDLSTGLARVHEKHLHSARGPELDYLGAWDSEHVLGTAVILWQGMDDDSARERHYPMVPEIAHLQVGPASRGEGVGTAPGRHSEQLVRGAGYSSVVIAVSMDNDRAAKLYERLGYTPTGATVVSNYTWTDTEGVHHPERETNTVLERLL
ncbi:MAG: GNAT family N-acetyltransferase [Ornithinimicrobium sp.]